MRRFVFLPILASLPLLACQKQRPADSDATGALADAAAHAVQVPCALGGAAAFQIVCTIERTVSGDGLILVLHHPDGGFRRLLVMTDGRGVMTADGSEHARVSIVDPGTIEVDVGDDRYRLPATVKGRALPER